MKNCSFLQQSVKFLGHIIDENGVATDPEKVHEQGKNNPDWQRLRLIIVHSKEVYIPLNINQSPFNVGLGIELPEFNLEQVKDF